MNIIVYLAEEAVTQFERRAEAEVVVDVIVRAAVVEVDRPVACAYRGAKVGDAVVANDNSLYRVEHDEVFFEARPEPLAAPAVKRAVLAGLHHRVPYIAVLEDVPAPGAIVKGDPGPRDAVDGAVGDRNAKALGDDDRGGLLAEYADVAKYAVGDRAILRVVGRFRAGR